MLKSRRARFAVVAFVGLAASARAQPGQDAVGVWDVTLRAPRWTRHYVLEIGEQCGALTGRMKGAREQDPRPVENLSVTGSEVMFQYASRIQGRQTLFTYKGTLADGAINGTVELAGIGKGNWSALPFGKEPKPAPADLGPADVKGTWQATVETSAGNGAPTFVLVQQGNKLTGTYRGVFGEAVLTGTVQGRDVHFAFNVNYSGEDMLVTYFGSLEDKSTVRGRVQFGNLGQGVWKATRQ